MEKKFEPADDRRTAAHADNEGTIVIKVFLASYGHRPVKGNMVKSIRIKNGKVSEVASAITEALFKE